MAEPRALLQVQPQYAMREEWQNFALREKLTYEPIEFSMPALLERDSSDFPACLAWYKDSGLVTALHGAFIDINPASGDPAFRRLSRKRCEESCLLASELGAKYVVLHGSAFPFLRGVYLEYWADTCAEFYGELAERHNLTLCIENSLDLNPEPLQALMKRISDKRVRVCLDIGHANYSEAPLEAWFDAIGEYIAYLHLSDNTGHYDDHLPLGKGTVDWAKADSLWRGLRRDTPMTLEVGNMYRIEESLRYLRSNRFFGLRADTDE